MRTHISPIAKQRISDFFTQEDGNVGRKNALMAGTVLSSVILAAALFGPEAANAGNLSNSAYWCGSVEGLYCSAGQNCCSDWVWVDGEKDYFYFCVNGYCPPQNSG